MVQLAAAALQPLADSPVTAKWSGKPGTILGAVKYSCIITFRAPACLLAWNRCMQGSVGMHASVPGQPNFSDTPILQPAAPTKSPHGSVRAPVPPKEHGFPAARQHHQLEPRIQQLLAPQAALPVAAGLLLLLNHYDAVWSLIRHVGVIDCIALSCLAMSVILAAPHLMMLSTEASKASYTSFVRLPEMADNIATLSSAVRLVQQDPAPRHWLDMYYNLCSDVDNLLQEMSKVRKLMAEKNTDAAHVKDKTAWMRKANKN